MPTSPAIRTALHAAVLAALYLFTGALGLSLGSFGEQVTLLWAPAGLAVGALVIGGRRLWPGVWLGALLVNLWFGTSWWGALSVSVGNTLEGVVGATLLIRSGFSADLRRLGDVGRFLAVGVVGAPMIAATIGMTALVATGVASSSEAPMVWLLWWLGDGAGVLVVAPVLLTGARLRQVSAEGLGLAAVLALTMVIAFGTVGPHTLPMSMVPFVLVVAAALRQGVPLASALVLLSTTGAVLGAFANTGAFVHDGRLDLAQTWAYMLVLGSTTLVVASLVAERRSADLERQRVQAAALEAQHLEGLGLVAAGVAHDFNNLLQVIQGHAAVARTEPCAPHLEQIDASVREAALLCDQLLTYAGRAPSQPEPLELGGELAAIRHLVQASIPAGVRLEVHDGQRVTVMSDRSQLQRVVLNLLSNAAEAIPEGGGRIDVRIGVDELSREDLDRVAVVASDAEPGRYGWVEVEDTGSGMTPEVQEKLFEPFFTTRFQGRGLGMASVVGVLRSHDGAIEVVSRPGKGSRLRLWLPWTDAAPAPASIPPTPLPPVGPVRVLLVDDDDAVRRVACMVLERAGYEVVEAASGRQAVERCDDPGLRVVVLDYTMPDMDGAMTARELRARRPDLPIVLCSGLGPDQVRGDADAFLQKPFRPSELEAVIRDLLPAD